MSFAFVESFGDTTATVEIDGRTRPVPCLIEDDDGIRLFVTDDPDRVLATTWHAAHAAGAAALVYVADRGWLWMLAETFMAERTEHHPTASYVIPAGWSGPDEPLAYRSMSLFSDPAEQQLRDMENSSGFVHLHTHSEFSPLDGMSKIEELVREVTKDGQRALAVTDHGVCASHPHLQEACNKAGIKPIFGIEANFCDDRHKRPIETEEVDASGKKKIVTDAKEVAADYTHLVMWAMDDAGLRNLWGMSTEANREGFYYRARMDWDTLTRFNEGVMASTGCLRGPLAKSLLAGDTETARSILARLMDIFTDRLYVEIHTNHLPEQIRLNHALVALAAEYDLPVIVAVDSHYPCKEDRETHQVWIASQTNKDVQDDADLFAGGQDYHMLTEAEVREAIAYLGPQVVDIAVENTGRVADRCTAILQGKTTTPTFSKVGGVRRDVERLVEICLGNWQKKVIGKTKPEAEYEARFEREMKLLIDKSFCGYFLMVSDYCRWARAHGILVGPGRGSGGGSLVAYLCDIVEIDAVDAELLFERFLTEGRTSLPDFDVDFPTSKRADLEAYIRERWGEQYCVRVGTHVRLKNKGVIRTLAGVLKSTITIHWPDIDAISKIITDAESDKAGKGMPWEDLWDEHGEVLQPYRDKYPLLFTLADNMVGRLKSYGKHAAGMVIATDEPLVGRLPMRMADEQMVAEFDMEALEMLGLTKFDLLTLRTIDTIQECVDLIREQRGIDVNVYDWKDEYTDPLVWDEVSDGHTLGIFQIETRAGTKLTRRFRPQSLHELADVITLVRPGPVRSGLTETYFRRRAGAEEVTLPDPRLEQVLAKTQGCILYQEDIMQTCMVLAGYDSNEADVVRKILGKKQTEKVAEAGQKFIGQSVQGGMDRAACEHLWEQMAEFAKYSFNRAHAFGYAVLGFWTAWLKFHYPTQFLTALLSTVDQDRIPEFVNEARRMGYKVLPPDINKSGKGFSAHQTEVRYGLDKVKGVGEAALRAIVPHQPFTSFEDFMARKGSDADSGVVKKLAAVGAFDSLEPNRKQLERRLDFSTSGEASRCVHKDESKVPLPCGFDWDNEVNPPMIKVKKEMVPKPPPKKCTKACRHFTPPLLDVSSLLPYTDEEIREKEMAMLGIALSSTPFDRIPPDVWDDPSMDIRTGDDVDTGPEGEYFVVAVVSKVRTHVARNGKTMAFIGLFAQTSDVDVTVFADDWKKYRDDIRMNTLCAALLRKNDRGVSLLGFQPFS